MIVYQLLTATYTLILLVWKIRRKQGCPLLSKHHFCILNVFLNNDSVMSCAIAVLCCCFLKSNFSSFTESLLLTLLKQLCLQLCLIAPVHHSKKTFFLLNWLSNLSFCDFPQALWWFWESLVPHQSYCDLSSMCWSSQPRINWQSSTVIVDEFRWQMALKWQIHLSSPRARELF